MNFLGGSLPNVMFIIGVLAIGLGLGIELKLVPLNKEIDKTGRIGAMVVGALLVAGSLYIYLNPALTNPGQLAPTAQAAASTNAQLIAAPTAVNAAPSPSQFGHIPCGLLKLNSCGLGGSKLSPQCEQA